MLPIRSRGLLLLLASAGLAACTMLPTAEPGKIEIFDDPFRPFVEYQAGGVRVAQGQTSAAVRLAGRIDRKTRAVSTMVFVETAYIDRHRRDYHRARNVRAEALAVTKHTGSGNCMGRDECPHSEAYFVAVPPNDLRAAGAEGYAIKVFAKNGPEVTLVLPRGAITALMTRLDAEAFVTSPAASPKS